MTPGARTPIIALVNLGCAKNTADSERVLGQVAAAGFAVAENPADADLCLVNTCGFIEDARKETAEVLEELQSLKDGGRLKMIAALGCMVRQAENVPDHAAYLERADALIPFDEYDRLAERCMELLDCRGDEPCTAGFLASPRLRIGSPHTAYLKISEGCSNACRFCTIPSIRGPQISRPVEELETEARQLIHAGARELVLIAQDTTSYGKDLYGDRCLDRLLARLLKLDFDGRLRVMYAYPRFLNDAVLDVMASDARICPYLDMPLQHINDDILRRMGRGMGKRETLAALDRVADRFPDAVLRTTFIAGYPGEKEAAFEELRAFAREGRFMHAGVFTYSPEPGTPAGEEEDTVPSVEKQRRADALMEAQLDVSRRKLAKWRGKTIEVMLDAPLDEPLDHPVRPDWAARTAWQAPEVDGLVLVRAGADRRPGERIMAKVEDSLDYDLVAVAG